MADQEQAQGAEETTDEQPGGAQEEEEQKQLTPQDERRLYKDIGYKKEVVGEIWYPIAKKWWDSWVAYTAYDKRDDEIDGGLENLHLRDVERPGPMDNSELGDKENKRALTKELQVHLTHEWVHEDQWNLLVKWYGGGPAFPREVCERGGYTREKYINQYPVFINFKHSKLDAQDPKKRGMDTVADTIEEKSYARETSFRDIIDDFQGESEGSKPTIHLWIPFKLIFNLYPIKTSRGVEVTQEMLEGEDQTRYLEVPDDYLSTKLEDFELPNDLVAIVEHQDTESKVWPMARAAENFKDLQVGDIVDGKDEQDKWYEAFIRYVDKENDPPRVCMHYIGWKTKWDEWVVIGEYERIAPRGTHTTGPHRPAATQRSNYGGGYSGYGNSGYGSSWSYYSNEKGSPDQRGVVGLRNLGNTCFMNSTIQCLAQSPKLTDYFLNDEFIHHINRDNPLGWNGKVAEAWSNLLKNMFSGDYRTVAPTDFKAQIGKVAPRFVGYAQQDSQELLSFLLDGLHEDLNQIKKKPPTAAVESDGRADHVVAAEAWKTYLKRNQSIIVDLMQGQFKSRVECPDCGRISITFDPYMFLSVPLPTEKYTTIEFTWIDGSKMDETVPPKIYGIKILKLADVDMLKAAIGKKFGVPKEELFVCDIWKSKIHRDLRHREMVADINPRNDDIFVYYAPKPESVDTAEEETPADAPPADEPAAGDGEDAGDVEAGAAGGEDDPDPDDDLYDAAPAGGNNNKARPMPPPPARKAPKFRTFYVILQTKVQVKSSYYYSSSYREEDEAIGVPLLVTFPSRVAVTYRQAREKLFSLLKPWLTDDSITSHDQEDLPFEFYALYGYNTTEPLSVDKPDDEVPLGERGFKFLVHFQDRKVYNEEVCLRESRERDESAPDPDQARRYAGLGGSGRPVSLDECLAAFTEEETLDENDAWYCSSCKDFKCATKKIDLWSVPDLLIIHLKRFAYTRQWRDRINTLVNFPISGLDLGEWVVDPDHKHDAKYDLYAISNHMGGLGGGHYTAYARNLDSGEWYHLDDSRTSRVHNPESMVSSSAYVLYYQRQTPRDTVHRASRVVIPAEPDKAKSKPAADQA